MRLTLSAPAFSTLEALCRALDCQPGDLPEGQVRGCSTSNILQVAPAGDRPAAVKRRLPFWNEVKAAKATVGAARQPEVG